MQTPASLNEDRKLPIVPKGTMLIAFHSYPSLIAFVIDHNGIHIIRPGQVAGSGLDLAQWASSLHRAMKDNNVKAYQRISYLIYANTLEKALARRDVKNMVVIPDGPMNSIPVEALVTDTIESAGWSDLHYVLDRMNVRYARSIQEALRPPVILTTHRINFAVAQVPGLSQLPFASKLAMQEEKRDGQTHDDRPVTRATIIGFMHSDDILHIATHAEAPTRRMLYQG